MSQMRGRIASRRVAPPAPAAHHRRPERAVSAFKDHFSRQAAAYSRYRPAYPLELIACVAALAPSRGVAIDCATGSGQAAIALARHFERVIAVDGSVPQLIRALPAQGVQYVAALAERLPLAGGCADLVTAAQAAHWFDFERFYAECRRVLRPGGVVAAWTYGKFHVDPTLDALVDHFYTDVVGRYWPPERSYVEAGYRDLPFPLAEESTPAFKLVTEWDLEQLLGYIGSWSAVQRYRDSTGEDPLPVLRRELQRHWGQTRRLEWPLHLRVGRV
jgi:SAM-dependent methyltransferase